MRKFESVEQLIAFLRGTDLSSKQLAELAESYGVQANVLTILATADVKKAKRLRYQSDVAGLIGGQLGGLTLPDAELKKNAFNAALIGAACYVAADQSIEPGTRGGSAVGRLFNLGKKLLGK